jgi:alanine racemase
LSNKGMAVVAGKRAAFVGRVSMDMVTLDVSAHKEVKTGDTVEFLGDHMMLEEVAAMAGTNAYEILTGLRVPRHYVDGSVGEAPSGNAGASEPDTP